jgi:hypothetical protein
MTIAVAQAARIAAVLADLIRVNGLVYVRGEWVAKMVAEGAATRITQEDRIKPMSRRRFNQADNEQQREHERRVKAGGKKSVYWIDNYEVTKTEHDHAAALIAAKGEQA